MLQGLGGIDAPAGGSFHKHVSAVARLCNNHAQAIRHLLTTELAQTLACSLVLFRIDYCNAVLHGSPSYSITMLQRVQNNAARVVLEAPRRPRASPLLRTLHWLSIQQRIDYYKVALLTFKVRSTSTSSYLRLLIQDQEHGRNLRSTTTTTLSTFHGDICETRFSMLCCTSCLELTTKNRSQ